MNTRRSDKVRGVAPQSAGGGKTQKEVIQYDGPDEAVKSLWSVNQHGGKQKAMHHG